MINTYVNKLINNLPDQIKNEKNPIKIDLVLDGGIFNGSYLLGALYFLKEMEKNNYIIIERISGCSIGSLAAFIYFIDSLEIMDKLYEIFFENFKKEYKLNKIMNLYYYLNDHIPENICKMVNDKLYITFYNIKKNKKVIKSKYKNKKDIIDTIIKSCFVPYLINGNKMYKNKYIDGINPYIFKIIDNKKILYLDLFGYDKINNLINVKNEKTNYHRILNGLLDIHNFFIKNASTPMCSYVNNWNIINKTHINIKIIFEKIVIYIIIFSNYLNKQIGNDLNNSIFYKFLSKIIYDFYIILLETYCL
jgi:hypothetical protein